MNEQTSSTAAAIEADLAFANLVFDIEVLEGNHAEEDRDWFVATYPDGITEDDDDLTPYECIHSADCPLSYSHDASECTTEDEEATNA